LVVLLLVVLPLLGFYCRGGFCGGEGGWGGHRGTDGSMVISDRLPPSNSGILVLLVRLTVDLLTATLCFCVLRIVQCWWALSFGVPFFFARPWISETFCAVVPSVRTSRLLLLRSVFVFAVAFRIGLFGGKAANEHRDSMVNSIHLSSRKFCRPFINRLSFNSSCRSCYCLCASELEDKSARDLSIFFYCCFGICYARHVWEIAVFECGFRVLETCGFGPPFFLPRILLILSTLLGVRQGLVSACPFSCFLHCSISIFLCWTISDRCYRAIMRCKLHAFLFSPPCFLLTM
jgi:hypothetical protein